MLQNIINDLKNQDIEADDAQINLIKNIVNIQTKKKTVLDSLKGRVLKNSFYTWGAVGRGKTLLSEAILKNIGNGKSSISFHFIDFMHMVHSELSRLVGNKDPLNIIAKSLSSKYKIMLIDEFQVEDVADAMIIGNLLSQILKNGSQLFLTSNVHPDDLYKDGLQRQKFMKSIAMIKDSLNIYELKGLVDYRARNIFKYRDNSNSSPNKDEDILRFIKSNFSNHEITSSILKINSRKFRCKSSSEDFLWVSFNDFFNQSTGSKDFIEISKNFEWVFINDFAECDDNNADTIRRFISFIDISYRENTKVKFFFGNINHLNIYKGTRLKILWDRCLSRLTEMQTIEYLNNT
ncbi:cell division protein ZapE [Gammaproteobacteria bacterium]|nr:cell division protein ZapE [Gammaproteobacteria bacterium]|tara:strand:+ start:60 stop:1106 length:1047 start_codon:yes stop_codon:yes gene_type:complete